MIVVHSTTHYSDRKEACNAPVAQCYVTQGPMLLRILVLREGDWFVAQCLEVDLGACAKNLDDVMYELQKTIVGQLFLDETRQRKPFQDLPPAPEEFFQAFQKACAHAAPLPNFRMPPTAPRLRPQVRIADAAA